MQEDPLLGASGAAVAAALADLAVVGLVLAAGE